jgi:hypothetical protein
MDKQREDYGQLSSKTSLKKSVLINFLITIPVSLIITIAVFMIVIFLFFDSLNDVNNKEEKLIILSVLLY